MTNASTTELKSDIGLVFDVIDGTTTPRLAVLTAQITKAQRDVRDLTGTTTGSTRDRAIRNLADYYVVMNAMSNLDPNQSNFEAFQRMADGFMKGADGALRKLGRTLDGVKVQFVTVNP